MVMRLPPREETHPRRTTGLLAMVVVLLLAVGIWLINGRDPGTSTSAPDSGQSTSGSTLVGDLPLVQLADLPPEATETVALVEAGGPFPCEQDGGAFGNFEGLLPDRPDGYYSEYTVETPGSDDRGARRIVAGEEGELYWTADHYASFEQILGADEAGPAGQTWDCNR